MQDHSDLKGPFATRRFAPGTGAAQVKPPPWALSVLVHAPDGEGDVQYASEGTDGVVFEAGKYATIPDGAGLILPLTSARYGGGVYYVAMEGASAECEVTYFESGA